jgi:hypothetical protein
VYVIKGMCMKRSDQDGLLGKLDSGGSNAGLNVF